MRWLAALVFAGPAIAGDIATSSVNGDAVVTWNGAVVWQGRTQNALRAAAITTNGREIAAAFDGEKTVWESEPGVGLTVRNGSPELKIPAVPPNGPVAGKGVITRLVNGETTLVWRGQEVWRGTTSALVKSKSRALNGAEIAAAFDGAKVIWESEPGAAERLR